MLQIWVWCSAALTLVLRLGCTVLLSAASVVVYRVWLHPLSKVPGPRVAAVSSIWQALQVRNGRMAYLAKILHHRYGPVVRVGPNEVWFNSKEAFKAIYVAGSGYEKSDFYLATALTRPKLDFLLRPTSADTLDLLSERDMSRYRRQRRLIGSLYQASNVEKYARVVDEVLDRAVERLRSLEGQSINLKEWMHIMAVECLGAAVLSWSPGMLRSGTDHGTSSHSYKGWRRKSLFGLFPLMAKLEMLSKALGRWSGNIWGVTYHPPPNFRPFFPDVQKRVTKRIKVALRSAPVKDNRSDLMRDLIQLHLDKPHFDQNMLRRMAMTNFGAGHETLASTLTSIMACLGTHGRVQEKLRQVVHSDSSDHPYLQAVIKESKRLHPVVTMSLPRTVPRTGLRIHDYYFPPGTTVGCNPVALHRNSEICAGTQPPDKFCPERWLAGSTFDSSAASHCVEKGDIDEVTAEDVRNMERYSLAWGGGARSCPGRHLAEMIVARVVKRLVAEFEVTTESHADHEQPMYFLGIMTNISARFEPLKADRNDTA